MFVLVIYSRHPVGDVHGYLSVYEQPLYAGLGGLLRDDLLHSFRDDRARSGRGL